MNLEFQFYIIKYIFRDKRQFNHNQIMSFAIPNLDAFYLKTHADELLRLYYDDPVSLKTVKMLEDLCRKLRNSGEKLEKYYKDCFDDLFDLLTR